MKLKVNDVYILYRYPGVKFKITKQIAVDLFEDEVIESSNDDFWVGREGHVTSGVISSMRGGKIIKVNKKSHFPNWW